MFLLVFVETVKNWVHGHHVHRTREGIGLVLLIKCTGIGLSSVRTSVKAVFRSLAFRCFNARSGRCSKFTPKVRPCNSQTNCLVFIFNPVHTHTQNFSSLSLTLKFCFRWLKYIASGFSCWINHLPSRIFWNILHFFYPQHAYACSFVYFQIIKNIRLKCADCFLCFTVSTFFSPFGGMCAC